MSSPVAKAYVFIQRPVEEVFAAFADAEITKRFWFRHAVGQLGPDAHVIWIWQARGIQVEVNVRDFVPNERIAFDWDGFSERTHVALTFKSYGKDGTSVSAECIGFSGDAASAAAIAATEGFAFLLAEASVWLEHGIRANLVLGFPPGPKVAII